MITAATAFSDPRTGRAYEPGDIIAGLSANRARQWEKKGLVSIQAEAPGKNPGMALQDGFADEQLVAEYDAHFLRKPAKWTELVTRNEAAHRYLSQHLGHVPESVLDVGCGNGHTLAYVAERWPEAALFGLDISPEGLKLAREKVPEATFFEGFLEDWEPPRTFEAVICLVTMEHFRDLPVCLARFKNLIAQDGFGYIEVPHNLSYSPGPEEFRRLSGGSRQWEWHLRREGWEALIIEAGLEIVGAYQGERDVCEFLWVVR